MWADGMRTFTYTIRDGVVAKHVFTCNLPTLQEEPTVLFHDIQVHVELSRHREGFKIHGSRVSIRLTFF